jgi:hypothetical protein
MTDVLVWDAKGVEFDEDEMSLSELPPIPLHIQEALLEAGGTCDGKPNVRIVSGLDPDIKEFYGGRWWRKYAFRSHQENRYVVYHESSGKKRILSPKEAEILGKQKNLRGILLPVVEDQIFEYGIPRYFVEYYKPPEYFGSHEAWEHVRYDKDENGEWLDLMGDFPSEGVYETWFCIEDPVVGDDGKVSKTRFRQIDDVVLEFIKLKIEETKHTSAMAKHAATRKEVDAEYLKNKEDLKGRIADIVADRIDRIIE